MRFYLLDRVVECVPGSHARGLKCVSLGEDYIHDHFPGVPIMPGLLILEGLAQLSGYLLARTARPDAPHEHKAVVTSVERAKFARAVRPGQVIELESRIEALRDDSARMRVGARVEDQSVVEARMVFGFVDYRNPDVEEDRRRIFAIWGEGSTGERSDGAGLEGACRKSRD